MLNPFLLDGPPGSPSPSSRTGIRAHPQESASTASETHFPQLPPIPRDRPPPHCVCCLPDQRHPSLEACGGQSSGTRGTSSDPGQQTRHDTTGYHWAGGPDAGRVPCETEGNTCPIEASGPLSTPCLRGPGAPVLTRTTGLTQLWERAVVRGQLLMTVFKSEKGSPNLKGSATRAA